MQCLHNDYYLALAAANTHVEEYNTVLVTKMVYECG